MTDKDVAVTQSSDGRKKRLPDSALAWGVVIAVVLCGLVTNGTSTMINPSMKSLLEFFGEGTTWGGGLASVFSLTSAILIIPLGILVSKFSVRWTIVISMVLVILGNVGAGVLNGAGGAGTFYVLRIVAALGYAGVYATGAVMICRWFTPEKRSIPMGCWNTVAGLGSIAVLNAGSLIIPNFGWQGLWIYQGCLGVAALVLFVIIVRERPDVPSEPEVAKKATSKNLIFETLKNPVIWCGCLIIGFSGVAAKGIGTFSSMIYVQTAGVDQITANTISSMYSLGQICAPLIGGVIYKAVKEKRGIALTVLYCIGMVFYICLFTLVKDATTAWVFAALAGFTGMMFMPGLYTLVADHCPSPEVQSIGFTVMMFGMFFFGIIGPTLMGWFQDAFGDWSSIKYLLAVLLVLGGLAGAFCAVRDKKYFAEKHNQEK